MEDTISERLKKGRGEQVGFYHDWKANLPFRDFIGKNYMGIGKEELNLNAACWYYRAVSMQKT